MITQAQIRVIRLSLRGAQPLMVSLSNHVAISLRLNTRRQIAIATATRLPPPYQVRGRNDMSKTEGRRVIRLSLRGA